MQSEVAWRQAAHLWMCLRVGSKSMRMALREHGGAGAPNAYFPER
jgi:hypothetical protein